MKPNCKYYLPYNVYKCFIKKPEQDQDIKIDNEIPVHVSAGL